MKTTIRIDDDLLRELREQSSRLRIPLTELVNWFIRRGLDAEQCGGRLVTYSMGRELVPLD